MIMLVALKNNVTQNGGKNEAVTDDFHSVRGIFGSVSPCCIFTVPDSLGLKPTANVCALVFMSTIERTHSTLKGNDFLKHRKSTKTA